MKNIFKIILIFLFCSCNAQSPVIDLDAWRGQTPANFYLKDVYNVLNPFEGTWLYTNGNTTLKIKLKKITLSFNGLYYEDLLIGEYQYIKDGEELFNTLSEIDNILTYQDHHNISGNILQNTTTPFHNFTTDNFRVRLYLKEDSLSSCTIDIRKTTSGGLDAIQIIKRSRPPIMTHGLEYGGSPMIDDGFYVLVKVN